MIERVPGKIVSHLDRKISIIKKVASSAGMGVFSLLFIVGFGTFYFLFGPLEEEIVIPAIIFTLIAIGMIAQTIATVAPLLFELWRLEVDDNRDEPLFP